MALNLFQVAGVVWRHWGQLMRVAELAAPLLTEWRKVGPELTEHLNDLSVALGLARNASPETMQFDVKWIQGVLTRDGFPVENDGDYGPATHEAVKAFQTKHGLDADGWVGPETAAAMMKL
ncbi:MAG TPA: peptidoglycan-binding domain-containing protein [Mesorhizobium sp.]|nr:peptidoglycan-binding domain-containing protein [Mesorhizobium sp.]